MLRIWPLLCALALISTLIGPFGGTARAAITNMTPVIVIPGVGGSEFAANTPFRLSVNNGHGGVYTRDYGAGETVWVNTLEALALGDDDYFDALKFSADTLAPVAPELRVSGIYHSVYDDLLGYLQRMGYRSGVDLWIYPYDWRRDIRTTNGELDALVTRALETVNGGGDPATWTIKRVDIVAHSMGGLVGRSYISDPARASRVDKLITLGTPALGTPGFIKALVYGDTMGPWFLGVGLNPAEIKDVVQNLPGGMQLLSSAAYYAYYDNSDATHLRPWVEDRDIDGDGLARGAMSYGDVSATLLNLRKNQLALGMAESFHNDLDRARHGGVNGVRWSALVGTGYGTLGQMREYTGSCWVLIGYKPCPKRDEIPVDGDGTVPAMSAAMGDRSRDLWLDSGAERTFMPRQHTDLVKRDYFAGIPLGDGPALQWIGDRLRETNPAATAPAVSAVTAPDGQLSGAWISALGPVALQLRDADGRGTGRTRGAAAKAAEMPETQYEQLPGGEFAFAKRELPYVIQMDAEGAGSVDLKLRVFGNGRVERTAVYLGVYLGPRGHAELPVAAGVSRENSPKGWPALRVDADGDGVFEASVAAAAVLDERASADTTPPDLIVAAPVPNKGWPGRVTMRWRAADQGAGLHAQSGLLDPGAKGERPVTNGQPMTLSPGRHRLLVVAVDRAGNASSQELEFTVPG